MLLRPFDTLSHGEQTKIQLAALFLRPNRFLLIDEPTNHLDEHARRKVSDYLRLKKGYILVSHDRSFLDNCIDHILSINKTRIEVQKGNFSSWWQNKELRDRFETAENEKLEKEIGKLTNAVRQTAAWSDKVERSKYGNENLAGKLDRGYIGHKAAKMMKRSKAIAQRRQQAVEDKSALRKDIERVDRLALHPMPYIRQTLVEASNLSVYYGPHPVFEALSFTIRQGDRIALRGRNGCGKSSLVKLLMGEEIAYTGELRMGSGLVKSYISQDIACLQGSLEGFVRDHGLDEPLFRAILAKLDVPKAQWDRDVRDFSDGQKKKVLLARSLCEPAHLYIWDEPLNFVDVISRMQIEELILACQPTMLLVEHDRAFIDDVATKQLEMQGNCRGKE